MSIARWTFLPIGTLASLALGAGCTGSQVSSTADWIAVEAGWTHTCGIHDDGSVECWGDDTYGQSTPPEGAFTSLSAVAHGSQDAPEHVCALRDDREIVCWGTAEEDVLSPRHGPYTAATTADRFACGLSPSGWMVCWGALPREYEDRLKYDQYAEISASQTHVCGIRLDGSATCTGHEDFKADPTDRVDFVQISTGIENACGIREDGTVYCWGQNLAEGRGTAGLGDPPDERFVQIDVGNDEACGVTEDGVVRCWGCRPTSALHVDHGQCDAPGGTFTRVSMGRRHACGVREDGAIECWGGQACVPNVAGLYECHDDHLYGQADPP